MKCNRRRGVRWQGLGNTARERHRNMNFEPQRLFVGVMDFFSILAPRGRATCATCSARSMKRLSPRALSSCRPWEAASDRTTTGSTTG